MVSRYPHIATITWNDAPVKDDLTGTYSEGKARSITVKGRLEPARQHTQVNADGRVLVRTHTFRCGVLDVVIPDSAIIEVNSINSKIIRQHNYQIYCEIWL